MVLWIGFDLQAEIEAVGANNWTALHLAAYYGKEAVAAQLLQAWASVSAVDDHGHTPLHVAASYGKSSLANLLLQANASSTAVDKNGNTTAQDAKQHAYGDLAARLLKAEQAAALKCERIPLVTLTLYTQRNFLNPLCGAVDWF